VSKILRRFRQSVLAAACSGRLTSAWRKNNTELTSVNIIYDRIQAKCNEWYDNLCENALREQTRQPQDPRKSKKSNKPVADLPEIPESWKYHRLEDLCYLITDGTHKTPEYRQKGIPFLSVKNVRPFSIDDRDIKFISEQEHNELISRCNPEKGDILYTKVGATFGYAAAVNIEYPFSIFVSLALIKPVTPFFMTDYVAILMNSESVFSQARDRVSGIGTPDLHLIEIRDFRAPLPPIEEQQEIVRLVEAMFKSADAVEKRIDAAKVRAEKLTQAILAKAFRGELVPTEAELARREGRSYETASELLARIKSEIDAKQTSQKVRRNRG